MRLMSFLAARQSTAASSAVNPPIQAMMWSACDSGTSSRKNTRHSILHARRHHRGRVDQGADGRGTFHRIGQPHMQRKLRGLARRAAEDAKAGRSRHRAKLGGVTFQHFRPVRRSLSAECRASPRQSGMPSMRKPKSPMRLVRNAFFAGILPPRRFSYQNPMSR